MKYNVTIYEVYSLNIEVDAENEHEAKEKASQLLAEGVAEGEIIYDHTMPLESWQVI